MWPPSQLHLPSPQLRTHMKTHFSKHVCAQLCICPQLWGVPPSSLLMVGDSAEDVEVGNAAGAASCLVAGGGNEKPGAAPAAPLPGAVPTFTVSGLPELRARLLAAGSTGAASGAGAAGALGGALGLLASAVVVGVGACPEASGPTGAVALGWPARKAAGLPVVSAGAPPPGMAFLDWLVEVGGLRPAACSFPRMGAAAGGLATCSEDEEAGDRVLHIGCGAGGVTKLMASQGMQVVGADVEVSGARRRGLVAVTLSQRAPAGRLVGSSLRGALAVGANWSGEAFDAVVLQKEGLEHDQSDPGTPAAWLAPSALSELVGIMGPYSRLCAEVPLSQSARVRNPAAIINAINASGLTVVAWQVVKPPVGSPPGSPQCMRLVAKLTAAVALEA